MPKSQPPKTTAKTPTRQAFSEPVDVKQQTERFNKAMELFHARELKKARDLFQQVADGPSKTLAFSARTHLRMCEQRLEKQQIHLNTAEDYYNFGIALTNQRKLEEAEKSLRQSLKMDETDYHHYALAVALALAGNVEEAATHLQKAIVMEPNNRIALRNDVDFKDHLSHPAIQAILNSQKALD